MRRMLAAVCAVATLAGCTSSASTRAAGTAPGPATSTATRIVSATATAPSSSAGSAATSASSGAATVGPAGGPVPSGFVPASASFVSASNGWVLGTAPCRVQPCTSVVRTRDGGSSWQGIPAPKADLQQFVGSATTGDVAGIRFADAADGWVYGAQLWSTHDGGATWHRLALPAGDEISSLETAGGSVYYATAGCQPASGGNSACPHTTSVYAAATGSDSFTKLATESTRGRQLLAVDNPRLTVQGGSWWLPLPSGLLHGVGRSAPAATAAAACADDLTTVFATPDNTHLDALCVGGGAAGSAVAQLRGSTDGGSRWTDAGPTVRVASGVEGISDNGAGVLVVAESSAATELSRTTDDGRSYAQVGGPFPQGGLPWSDVGFTTRTQAFAVLYRSTMYLSSDAGATWSPVSF